MMSKIIEIRSPSHNLHTNLEGKKANINAIEEKVKMNEDLVFLIQVEDSHKPRLITEKSEDGTYAAMITLVPSIDVKTQKTELVFLIDRSGSMQGESISQAKEALLIFLQSLPLDCYFNIIGFGSTYTSLFPKSVQYTEDSLRAAKEHVKGLGANLGGTEIYAPLDFVFKLPAVEGYLRQIFVLTDGEVSNTERVLSLVRSFSSKNRVFALGLGRSASHHLVGGIARLGGGTAAFATVSEELRKKVMNQLKNALQPSFTDISIILQSDGKEVNDNTNQKIRQCPSKIPPIFDGTRFVVYILMNEECLLSTASITCSSPDGPLKFDVEVSQSLSPSGIIHRYANEIR
ncbi:von Willebrand factor A domain-containing protein 5A-like [Artemia franciscana]|uniref:von Willebrand factor A domain-containing protein 5A-like n=1 Tax=Artemia franciscana TaxID=6661 RepID=UPI0032D9BB29